MIKSSVTAQEVCDLLNEMLWRDPHYVNGIIQQRIPCNDKLAAHPGLQCAGNQTLGLLGIFNGMFGKFRDGGGQISAIYTLYEDGRKELEHFTVIRKEGENL